MKRAWVRLSPDAGDTAKAAVVAAALAAGVGLASFYVVRMLLAREPVGGARPDPRPEGRAGKG